MQAGPDASTDATADFADDFTGVGDRDGARERGGSSGRGEGSEKEDDDRGDRGDEIGLERPGVLASSRSDITGFASSATARAQAVARVAGFGFGGLFMAGEGFTFLIFFRPIF